MGKFQSDPVRRLNASRNPHGGYKPGRYIFTVTGNLFQKRPPGPDLAEQERDAAFGQTAKRLASVRQGEFDE